ncbi:MAG: tetratricopeptide repeat protein, partial [Bdellovibrionales bacterium]|nr:tetratricopeptide repeat protein [Bdellovibrionales bacterium]
TLFHPQIKSALQGLSLVEKEMGNLEKAVDFLEESLLYRSTDTVSRFNLGVIYEELNEFAKAAREYRNVLEVESDNVNARERLVLLTIKDGKLGEAWDLLSEGSKAPGGKTSATLLTLKGYVAHERGDLEKAELAYREAIRMEPEDMTARLELSNILVKKEQPALALEVLGSGILEKVRDKTLASKLYNSRGWAQLELGKLEDAEQSLRTAVALDANNAHAFNNLGVLYQRTKKTTEAQQNFVKAIELKGDFNEARSNLKTLQRMLDEEHLEK